MHKEDGCSTDITWIASVYHSIAHGLLLACKLISCFFALLTVSLALHDMQTHAAEAARQRQAAKKAREEAALLSAIKQQMSEAQEAAAAKAADAKAAAEAAKRANIEAKLVRSWFLAAVAVLVRLQPLHQQRLGSGCSHPTVRRKCPGSTWVH